jgi:hypothetical protein
MTKECHDYSILTNNLNLGIVDIQINQVVVDDSLEPFDLRDLESLNNIRMTMKNNGHTGMLAFLYSCQIYIDSGKYTFVKPFAHSRFCF